MLFIFSECRLRKCNINLITSWEEEKEKEEEEEEEGVSGR